ncbi:uncharacterized protein CCOS01_13064 [Colletotrichum costaricense]|uniref:Uncharacterized protein n=1 Tax=Colletotrichum costaricense TaxID=1209916 RepID=A0AAJ0DW64_9PEZI|nr:uncharacterized protein CCOS01_13064 [Colletotrichum costaricense]KAK1515866.1 hypothetical protein CCOS01_13064 [Colletotrichum costaricense]
MPPEEGDEGDDVHGLYSGHIACSVSGHDYWRWTAHFAIDTWFDETNGINDQVTRYENDREDGVEWDPCSGGQDDARKPFWFPRIWFLRIFGIRLDQIKDEWESICLHLGQNLDRQDRKYKVLLLEAQLSPELAAAEDHRFRVNALEKSVLESRDVLQDLISVIQETLKAGASFLSTEVNFFLNFDGQPGDGSECYPYLSEIRRMFNVLNQLGYRLESYQARCSFLIQYCEVSRKNNPQVSLSASDERFAASSRGLLQVQVDIENLRNELIQVKLKNDQLLAIGPGDVEEVRVLAFSTLLTQAFSQTTALFSADGVIAFTRSWQTFLISLLVAYGINLTIGTAFLIWIRRARHKIQAALKATPLIPPVAQPTSNPSATSTVTLRSSSEAVTQTIATHTSSTNSDESGLTIYTRRRFSDRLWLSYRQPQRVDDVELGNRNVIEELT